MKKKYVMSRIAISLAMGGLVFTAPHGSVAQEAAQGLAGQEGSMSMHGMMGQGRHQGRMADMHKKHEQMMTKRKETLAELQQQLTALHEHTKTLESVTDQQQVLTELKKHQQMTDALLATMIEQRVKMHEAMQAHHEKMKEKMGKKGQSETQKSDCCGKAEASAKQTEERSQEHEAHQSSE